MERSKLFKRLSIASVSVVSVAAVALIGMTPWSQPIMQAVADESDSATQEQSLTSSALADAYPLEYAGTQQTRTNSNGITVGHDVATLRDICEAPVPRDENGSVIANEDGTYSINSYKYDEESGQYVIEPLSDDQLAANGLFSGCVSCKSSHFNELYEQQGASAFTAVYDADNRAVIADDYWDCEMCHDGTPSADNVGAQMVYFTKLGEGLIEDLPAGDAVCAQCHNSYDYRSRITTEDDLDTFRPYREGTDIDSVMEVCLEDGTNFSTDEETGITEAYLTHPDIELYINTTMSQMGVTCVDCHMPKTTDSDSAVEYTNHFAASSPLENPDALEYCLTCHKAQGIEDADAMVDYVHEKQDEMAKGMEELESNAAEFKSALEDAINADSLDDDTLDQAKELYAKVTFYDRCLVDGVLEKAGSRAPMIDYESILDKANADIEQGMALLG